METILQIAGFIGIAYLIFKVAPFVFNSAFKLSVIVIGITLALIIYSILVTDWNVTYV